MSTRTRTIGTGVAVFVVAAIAALAWYLAQDAVAEVDIDAAAGSATPSATTAAAGSVADLAGEWTVTNTDGGDLENGTFVGYRVDEKLAGVGATTAVGRTAAVEGALTVESDGTVSDAIVEADVSQLSPNSRATSRSVSARSRTRDSRPACSQRRTSPSMSRSRSPQRRCPARP